jgi:hypothetical protein
MKKNKRSLIISKGNTKLGSIANISTVPVIDCNNSIYCSRQCYARKSYRLYRRVRHAWRYNSKLIRADLNRVENDLNVFCSKYKGNFFRYHVAGDILHDRQFDVYKRLAANYPGIKFLQFTKNYYLDFKHIPDNFTVILSTWINMPLPRNRTLPRAWIIGDKRIPDNKVIECPGRCDSCGMCFSLNKLDTDVSFRIH